MRESTYNVVRASSQSGRTKVLGRKCQLSFAFATWKLAATQFITSSFSLLNYATKSSMVRSRRCVLCKQLRVNAMHGMYYACVCNSVRQLKALAISNLRRVTHRLPGSGDDLWSLPCDKSLRLAPNQPHNRKAYGARCLRVCYKRLYITQYGALFLDPSIYLGQSIELPKQEQCVILTCSWRRRRMYGGLAADPR